MPYIPKWQTRKPHIMEYEPLSVQEYEKHYRKQQIKHLEKKMDMLGFQLTPT